VQNGKTIHEIFKFGRKCELEISGTTQLALTEEERVPLRGGTQVEIKDDGWF